LANDNIVNNEEALNEEKPQIKEGINQI